MDDKIKVIVKNAPQKIKVKLNEVFPGHVNDNYEKLTNKPQINNIELIGNKTLEDLGIQPAGDYAEKDDIPNVDDFITNTVDNLLNYYLKSETYTKQEVATLINQAITGRFQVVAELPEEGESNVIYLVPSTNPKTSNLKDEYLWTNNDWEQIGSTEIDLSGYVKNTDYATADKGGVIKTGPYDFLVDASSGAPYANTKTYANYKQSSNRNFIGKGTLENVIVGKNLETANNKVTSIDENSTDTQYPSALAVYNYIQSINGNGVEY